MTSGRSLSVAPEKQNCGQRKASGRARSPYQATLLDRGLQLCKGVNRTEGPGPPGLSRMGLGGDNHLPGSSPGNYEANTNITGLQDKWGQYHNSKARSVQNYTTFNLAKNTFFKA